MFPDELKSAVREGRDRKARLLATWKTAREKMVLLTARQAVSYLREEGYTTVAETDNDDTEAFFRWEVYEVRFALNLATAKIDCTSSLLPWLAESYDLYSFEPAKVQAKLIAFARAVAVLI